MFDELIATHPTRNGSAIGIIRKGKVFITIRMAEFKELGPKQFRYIALHQSPTQHHARQMANREWLADMGRPFDI